MARITFPVNTSTVHVHDAITGLDTDYLSQTDSNAQAIASDLTAAAARILSYPTVKTDTLIERTLNSGITINHNIAQAADKYLKSDGVWFNPRASSVSNVEGMAYYDSDDNKLKFYDGATTETLLSLTNEPEFWVTSSDWDDLQDALTTYAGTRVVRFKGTYSQPSPYEDPLLIPATSYLKGCGPDLSIIESERTSVDPSVFDGLVENEHFGSNTQDNNVTLKDFSIKGYRSTTSNNGFGLSVEYVNDWLLEDVYVHGWNSENSHFNGTGCADPINGITKNGAGTSVRLSLKNCRGYDSGVDGWAFDKVTDLRAELLASYHGYRNDINGHGVTITRCHDGWVKAVCHDGQVGHDAGLMSCGMKNQGSYRMHIDLVAYSNNGSGMYNTTSTDEPVSNILNVLAYNNGIDGVAGEKFKYNSGVIRAYDNTQYGVNLFDDYNLRNSFNVVLSGNANGIVIAGANSGKNTWVGCTVGNTGGNTLTGTDNSAALIEA